MSRVGIILLLPVSLCAQTVNGSLSGFVTDPSGAALRAEVRAESAARGVSRTVQTDPSGLYRILELPTGEYRVSVSARNFQAASTILSIAVDARLRQDFTLAVGAVQQSVTVASVATSLGTVISRSQIDRLPLNRRDFLQLSLLVPGVAPPVEGSELSSRGSFAMHAGGAREEFNNFTADGGDMNDPYNNRYALQPPVESIAEFRVITNSYSAEYGRNAGAQVNVITRSGTNSWHGAAYEYFRNAALDARNFFDHASKPGFQRNQFGGSIGGPIRENRIFVFGNYEGLRERRRLSRLASVPTAAQRAGQFDTAVFDPFTQQPFAGNRVPASRIHPLSRRVLELFPQPDFAGAGGNHLAQPKGADASDNALARIDWGDFTFRYGYGRQALFEPFAEDSTDVAGFGNFVDNLGQNATLQHQRILSPTSILIGRWTWGRAYRRARQQNFATDVGALWGVSYLNVRPRDFGFPSIRIAGFSQVGDVDQLPLERTSDTLQWQQSLALVRGAHALKLGGEFRWQGARGYLDYFARGSMTFSGALTRVGLADLLLGLPSFALQSTFDNPQNLRSTSYALYLQDEWRAAPRLTLSAGLRWEFVTPATDPSDAMYVLANGQMQRVGQGGITRSGYSADRTNFAPRLGFAWAPGERWNLRGGYGHFYDSGMFVVNSSLYFNPPLFNVRAFFPTPTRLLFLDNPFPVGGGITPPPSPSTLSPDLKSSYLQHWNFTIDRQLDRSSRLSIGYAGSKGTHLIRSRDVNQPAPAPGPVQARRPLPQFAGIFYIESGGNSNYHALQAQWDQRLRGGVALLAGYTWAKSIDEASAFLGTKPDKNFPQNSANWALERGRSSFDVRHRATAALQWSVRGFEFRTLAVAQTGQPLTPILRFDNSNSGNTGSIFGSDRPNLIGNPRLDRRTPERWFNTAAFAIAPPNSFGNAGRNIVEGPGLVNFDVALSRHFRLTERLGLIAGVEMFNLANTAHFDLPERFADEPTSFGRIFSAKPPRQIQLTMRLAF